MRQLKNEQGQAMIIAVGLLVVLGMLGVSVAIYTTSGQRTASRSSAGVSAYSLAEAGINNAMSVLSRPRNAGATCRTHCLTCGSWSRSRPRKWLARFA